MNCYVKGGDMRFSLDSNGILASAAPAAHLTPTLYAHSPSTQLATEVPFLPDVVVYLREEWYTHCLSDGMTGVISKQSTPSAFVNQPLLSAAYHDKNCMCII